MMIYMSLYYVRVLLTSPKYVTWTRHLAKLINWTKTHWMKNHKTWTNPVNFILISYTMKFGAFTWIWHSLKWKTKTETFFKKHAIKIAAPILETFGNRAYSWEKGKDFCSTKNKENKKMVFIRIPVYQKFYFSTSHGVNHTWNQFF